MTETVIQIKRSTTDALPSNVVFGELAFTTNGNILYIGDDSNTALAIGGLRTPGVVTANQALVANSTGGIDNLIANTVTVTTLNASSISVSSANITGDITVANISSNNITVTNTLTVNGDIVLRGSSLQLGDGGDVISLGATVNSSIVPTTNNTFNLGSSTSLWKRLFVNDISQSSDAPLTRKLDILWKKVGFYKVSTDYITSKLATDESIVTDLIIKPSEIWNQTANIPGTKPASNTSVLHIYDGVECQEDNTSTIRRTWKTNITNWVPPRFGSTYQVSVYVDTTGSTNAVSNGTSLSINGSNDDGWYFDYQAGVLHFLGTNLPSGVVSGKSIFISGARYVGTLGFDGMLLTNANLVNATITSLSSPLAVSQGGTGVSSFTANSLLAAANSSALSFKTGANGQVMIITNNDVGFSDLDGGTY